MITGQIKILTVVVMAAAYHQKRVVTCNPFK